MSFQKEFLVSYTEMWQRAMLRMKSRLDSIYKSQGVQVNWKWTSSLVRGIGVVQDLIPEITYQRPTTSGAIPYNAMISYRKEYQRAETEFFEALSAKITSMFSKEFAESFSLEQIGKFVRKLDEMSEILESTVTAQPTLISTREARRYALEAEYLKRKAIQAKAREARAEESAT